MFATRYGSRQQDLQPYLDAFGGEALREWVHGLGVETFVGSSGRVFPTEMKAAPLLRAWLTRLREAGVKLHVRHRWVGWSDEGGWVFDTPEGQMTRQADAVLLALGGASWKKLGSDGAWVSRLQERDIPVVELLPSNCGFDTRWSEHFVQKLAGEPLKSVVASWQNQQGEWLSRKGEFVVTSTGVEGSLIYAISAALREQIRAGGQGVFYVDLLPDRSPEWVREQVCHPRGSRSLSSHLQSRLGLKGVKAGLLRECLSKDEFNDLPKLAAAIKRLPVTVHATRPIDEAISTAGGVRFDAMDGSLMLKAMPGVFCAGEMLDWEAPTGGYLLTACFATGHAAGLAMAQWLGKNG